HVFDAHRSATRAFLDTSLIETGRAQGQKASVCGYGDPGLPARTRAPEELLARDRVPAGYQGFVAVFPRKVVAESNESLAVGRPVHGTGSLIGVRPIGIMQFDDVLSFAGGRVADAQIIVGADQEKRRAVCGPRDAADVAALMVDLEERLTGSHVPDVNGAVPG